VGELVMTGDQIEGSKVRWRGFLAQMRPDLERYGFGFDGALFARDLEDTVQIVEYAQHADSNAASTYFTVNLGINSRRLPPPPVSPDKRVYPQNAHWHTNVVNLTPKAQAEIVWELTDANLSAVVAIQRGILVTVIKPTFEALRTDAQLLLAWREGGQRAGLNHAEQRAALMVRLALTLEGASAAESVGREILDRFRGHVYEKKVRAAVEKLLPKLASS